MSASAAVAEGRPPKVASRDKAWLEARIERGRKERFSEVTTITPSMATLMLERNTRNRQYRPASATKWGIAMKEKRWLLHPAPIAFSKTGVLLDGQHRLGGCRESESSFPATLWFGCEENEFSVTDIGNGRTSANMLHIRGMDWAATRSAVASMELRLQYRRGTFDSGQVQQKAIEMQSDTMLDALRQGMRVQKLVHSTTASTLAYLHIATKTSHPANLNPFWDGLVSGANLDSTSPILRVRSWFQDGEAEKFSSGDRTIKKAAALILAWNAYIQRRRPRNFDWDKVVELPEVV